MSKDNGFILYSCPICEVLLVHIEEKHFYYYNCCLDNEGCYNVEGTNDETFDEYLCPECGTGSDHTDEYGNILKKIRFKTIKTAKLLNKLTEDIINETNHTVYGIPLDREELKAIILEDSIGGN